MYDFGSHMITVNCCKRTPSPACDVSHRMGNTSGMTNGKNVNKKLRAKLREVPFGRNLIVIKCSRM